MDPIIVRLPAFTVAGHRIRTGLDGGANLHDIPAFWQRYGTTLRAPLLAALGRPHSAEYGMICHFDPATQTFDYLVGMECQGEPSLPPGATHHRVEHATYAVFTTPPSDDAGFSQSIVDTWHHIYQRWLPASSWQAAERESFERYDGRCLPGRPDRQLDIYVPVRPRER